jgi:oxidase EvaA
VTPTASFREWFDRLSQTRSYAVERRPLDDLDGWLTDPDTGDLCHRTGRFYRIGGLEVTTDTGPVSSWTQPVILQPEVGILGILLKEFDGVLHCLVQAKMEPGNINMLQLSPTVQATRSNYTLAHRGRTPSYLEYFTARHNGRVLVDSLQSEQGSWCLHKRNRNMVVEVTGDVPVLDGFCWLTLGQLYGLMSVKNLVNMDTRSILATITHAPPDAAHPDSFQGALARSIAARDGMPDVRTSLPTWLIDAKLRRSLTRRRIPLNHVSGWHRDAGRIAQEDGRFFEVIGVDVRAPEREVPRWSQPVVAPIGTGVAALIVKRMDGVLYALAQARTEGGTFDVAEIAPSVQCTPSNYAPEDRPRFLDYVLGLPTARLRFDTVLSEEGGRLYHAESRYMIVEAGDDLPADVPDDYVWATIGQLTELARHGNYLNVQLRTLLACSRTLG